MLNESNFLLLIVTVVRYLHQNLLFFPHQFRRQWKNTEREKCNSKNNFDDYLHCFLPEQLTGRDALSLSRAQPAGQGARGGAGADGQGALTAPGIPRSSLDDPSQSGDILVHLSLAALGVGDGGVAGVLEAGVSLDKLKWAVSWQGGAQRGQWLTVRSRQTKETPKVKCRPYFSSA